MPYRLVPLVNENYYHIFNRGVEKRTVFLTGHDYKRFLNTLIYYQIEESNVKFSSRSLLNIISAQNSKKQVEIIGYCLMPNHYHLLLKQNIDNGISTLLRKVSNSYTKYFNTKHERVGPLFQGAFKARLIENNEALLHVLRYIHLNPFVDGSDQVLDLSYPYSSYGEYVNKQRICNTRIAKELLVGQDFSAFHKDQIEYAREIKSAMHFDK